MLLVAGLVATGCGGGVEVSVSGPATASPSAEASTADLASPRPVADDPDPVVRAGAAGRQVDCDGAVHLGGWAPDFGGPHQGAEDPEFALKAFLDQGLFGLPTTGYGQAADVDGRVLFTYDVNGEAKVAVIVADAATGAELTVPDGWGIETFATCDPAEYGPAADDELRQTVWTDRDGARVPTSTVTSFQGPEHCDWQTVTFLHLEDRQYLRDPEGVLDEQTVVAYDGEVRVPADAVDTGYRRGEEELWLAADETVAYLVRGDGAEAWPRTTGQVACA